MKNPTIHLIKNLEHIKNIHKQRKLNFNQSKEKLSEKINKGQILREK